MLIPFVYMILISLGKNAFAEGGTLLPKQYTFQNYIDLFSKNRFYNWFLNSIILSLGTMVLALILTSVTVYVFSRLKFKGKEKLFSAVLLVQIFPLTLSMVSIHRIFTVFGMLNKIQGLIIVDSVMASAGLVLLAKGYFDTIPFELDESAQIDGAGRLTILWKIIIPLVKPMLAIVAVQSFVLAYNEYVIANVIMTGGFKSMPLAVGLQSMIAGQYGTNWSQYCAAAIIGSVPMIVIFYSMQKYLISGLVDGSVK
jgi:arabinogalactan oligomer/maltooligosaccharide transport system permease protein